MRMSAISSTIRAAGPWLALTALIGMVDYLTPSAYALPSMYFIPIFPAAWRSAPAGCETEDTYPSRRPGGAVAPERGPQPPAPGAGRDAARGERDVRDRERRLPLGSRQRLHLDRERHDARDGRAARAR